VRNFKLLLWAVSGLGAAVATARFIFGLGATTHLSDATPWGLWIGFDVMSGVALAAGGFVMTATVYIFKLEKFHVIVKPAVLTALLGYLAVAFGLLFDLGLPWNIWHMIVFWNPHSPLFEVGWCVMLYLTVLLLEFFPVPAGEFRRLAGLRNFLLKLRLPLVIAGIALSTLHQSSLGSLFLIMPFNLHPLWYSPILPILFFLSAVALGLMMVSWEGLFTAYLYRRKPETELIAQLGAAARWVFSLYLLVRFADLLLRGQGRFLWGGEWQVKMFWVEIFISTILPTCLLWIRPVRSHPRWQWVVAGLGVFGVVLNRINVGGLVQINRGADLYFPAWTEFAVSGAVVAAAALMFLFMVERFKVWEERPVDPDAAPSRLPGFDYASEATLGEAPFAARIRYSLGFIFAAALGFALLSGGALASKGLDPAPAGEARGGKILWIDGNLDGYGTSFPHEKHVQRNGGEASCALCHHMNRPLDENTVCSKCHRDMYQTTDAFGHDWHSSPTGARLGCFDCHSRGAEKTAATAKSCDACHRDLIPAGAVIPVKKYRAMGYVDAMHRLCIGCHVKKTGELPEKPDLERCVNCHREKRAVVAAPQLADRYGKENNRGVVLPYLESSGSDTLLDVMPEDAVEKAH
jgi:Ni/Fe-hydrogenase subunit HybB-like protein